MHSIVDTVLSVIQEVLSFITLFKLKDLENNCLHFHLLKLYRVRLVELGFPPTLPLNFTLTVVDIDPYIRDILCSRR